MADAVIIREPGGIVVVRELRPSQIVVVAAQGPQGPIGTVNPEMYVILAQAQAAAASAAAAVLSAILVGFSTLSGATVSAADTVLSALGKLQAQATAVVAALAAHIANTSNPHSVTKAQVGLGNADNTSDVNKPVSTATATALALKADSSAVTTALALKADQTSLTAHTSNTSNPHSTTKAQVGLGNVDNTSDVNKPVSTAQATAIALKSDLATTTTKTAATGASLIPGGTTGQRPTLLSTDRGFRYNDTLISWEGWNGTTWGSVGGGATGAGGDTVFQENSRVVNNSYTLTTGKSASAVGPISIATGKVLTVPSGERLVVL